MNDNIFDNLLSFNEFLKKEIDYLNEVLKAPRSEDEGSINERIDVLVKIINVNDHLIQDRDDNSNNSEIKLIKKIVELREESFDKEGGKSDRFQEVINKISLLCIESFDPSTNSIKEIRDFDSKIYYKILAGWIEKNKVPLTDLNMSEIEILEIAPYLTYLNLNGEFEFDNGGFVEVLLKKSENLKYLIIVDCEIKGSELHHLKNADRLQKLYIEDCLHFQEELPKNMKNIEKIKIKNCKSFKDGLPKEMPNLRLLEISECDKFNQELPQDLPNLRDLELKYCKEFNQKLPQDLPNLRKFELVKCRDFNNKLFQNVHELEKLLISDCPKFNGELPADIQSLKTLQILNCTVFNQNISQSMPNLQLMKIFGSSKFNQELPQDMPRLKVLGISNCRVFNQKIPQNLPRLSSLSLVYCEAFSESLPQNVPCLERLLINNCPKFNRGLPLEMPRLKGLVIKNCKIFNQKLAEHLKNLENFSFDGCPEIKFNRADFYKILYDAHQSSSHRAQLLAKSLNIPYDKLLVVFHFYKDHNNLSEEFFKELDKSNIERIIQLLENQSICHFIQKNVPGDPIKQLYSYNFFSKTEEKDVKLKFESFLSQIVDSPVDKDLHAFYRTISLANTLHIPDNISELLKSSNVEKFQTLSYLVHLENNWKIAVENINLFQEMGLWDEFVQKLPFCRLSARILQVPNLLKENQIKGSEIVEECRLFTSIKKDGLEKILEKNDNDIKLTLKTLVGRVLIEELAVDFLEDNRLQIIIKELYPPNQTQNKILYPIVSKMYGQTLYLTIIPEMPLLYPDDIFDVIRKYKKAKRFNITHFASPGIDDGGLSKQFISQAMQGICSHSKYYQFEELYSKTTGTQSLMPVNVFNPSSEMSDRQVQIERREEKENYHLLGRFLGLALNNGCPIGELFNLKFFDTVCLFTNDDLNKENFSAQEFFADKKLQPQQLLDFIKKHLTEVDETEIKRELFEKVQILLNVKEIDIVRTIANELNLIWLDDKLDYIIQNTEKEDVEEIKKYVVLTLADSYYGRLEVMQAMAKGISGELPFRFGKISVKKWDEMQKLKNKQFAEALQGTLSVERIKQNLKFKAYDNIANFDIADQIRKKEKLKQWVYAWLDENKDNPESLRNVVITCTGAAALVKDIVFCFDEEVKGLYPHTCDQVVDVPIDIDEEGLRATLDSWARKPELVMNTE